MMASFEKFDEIAGFRGDKSLLSLERICEF